MTAEQYIAAHPDYEMHVVDKVFGDGKVLIEFFYRDQIHIHNQGFLAYVDSKDWENGTALEQVEQYLVEQYGTICHSDFAEDMAEDGFECCNESNNYACEKHYDKYQEWVKDKFPAIDIEAYGGVCHYDIVFQKADVNDIVEMIDKDFKGFYANEYKYGAVRGGETTAETDKLAKDNGIVIVHGYSDDGCNFRGAIIDNVGCFDGGSIYFTKEGEFFSDKPDFPVNEIKAVWCGGVKHEKTGSAYRWTYETQIPHKTFDVMEESEPFCRGIIFSLNDLV